MPKISKKTNKANCVFDSFTIECYFFQTQRCPIVVCLCISSVRFGSRCLSKYYYAVNYISKSTFIVCIQPELLLLGVFYLQKQCYNIEILVFQIDWNISPIYFSYKKIYLLTWRKEILSFAEKETKFFSNHPNKTRLLF